MADQSDSMIRDSDIKFQCRVLLSILAIVKLPKELENEFLGPINEIVKLENNRLDKLKETK